MSQCFWPNLIEVVDFDLKLLNTSDIRLLPLPKLFVVKLYFKGFKELFRPIIQHAEATVDGCILTRCFTCSLQDLTYAMPLCQIQEILDVEKLNNRIWHLQPACGLTGAGVIEGIEWLYGELFPKKAKCKSNSLMPSKGWRWGALTC